MCIYTLTSPPALLDRDQQHIYWTTNSLQLEVEMPTNMVVTANSASMVSRARTIRYL